MVGNSLTDVFSMHRSVPWTPSTAGDDASDRSSAHGAGAEGHAEELVGRHRA